MPRLPGHPINIVDASLCIIKWIPGQKTSKWLWLGGPSGGLLAIIGEFWEKYEANGLKKKIHKSFQCIYVFGWMCDPKVYLCVHMCTDGSSIKVCERAGASHWCQWLECGSGCVFIYEPDWFWESRKRDWDVFNGHSVFLCTKSNRDWNRFKLEHWVCVTLVATVTACLQGLHVYCSVRRIRTKTAVKANVHVRSDIAM